MVTTIGCANHNHTHFTTKSIVDFAADGVDVLDCFFRKLASQIDDPFIGTASAGRRNVGKFDPILLSVGWSNEQNQNDGGG